MRKAVSIILAVALLLTLSILSYADSGTVILPDSLMQIGDEAFANTPAIQSVVAPEGLQVIGNGAFAGSGVRAMNLPGSLTSISDSAFDKDGVIDFTIRDRVPYNWAVRNGFVDGSLNTISSGDAYSVGNTSARIDVTMSTSTLLADQGYYWCILFSEYPDMVDEQGNDVQNYGYVEYLRDPAANASFSTELSDLLPGTQYYYKACIYVYNHAAARSEFVTIEDTVHSFTTGGSVSDLPAIVLDAAPTAVPAASHTTYHADIQAAGVYVLDLVNLDSSSLSLKGTGSGRIGYSASSFSVNDQLGFHAYFYASAGDLFVTIQGDETEAGTIALVSAGSLTTELSVGANAGASSTAVAANAGLTLFSLTPVSDGWYWVSLDTEDTILNPKANMAAYPKDMIIYYSSGETTWFLVSGSGDTTVTLHNCGPSYHQLFAAMGEVDRSFYFRMVGETVLNEDISLPRNVTLYVYGELTIPEGVTFTNYSDIFVMNGSLVTVNGTLTMVDSQTDSWTAGIMLNDGYLVVNGNIQMDSRSLVWVQQSSSLEDAQSRISGVPASSVELEIYVESEEELHAVRDAALVSEQVDLVLIDMELELTTDTDVPSNYCLILSPSSSVTVAEGTSVTVSGCLAMEGGTFINNGTVDLPGLVNIWSQSSTFVNNGTILFSGTIQKPANASYDGNGVIINNGTFTDNGGSLLNVDIQ